MDHRESRGSEVDRWMEDTGSEESAERMSLWRVSRSNWSCEISSLEECSELFLHEDWLEIVGIDVSIVLIPLFGIDIPASSEGIRFCTKLSGAETNNHVELGEELRPVGLPPGQELGSRKVLQVFVVSDHINWSSGALEVVTPQLEHLMDSKELLVVDIIVELWSGQSP